jgi:hypothetical protein
VKLCHSASSAVAAACCGDLADGGGDQVGEVLFVGVAGHRDTRAVGVGGADGDSALVGDGVPGAERLSGSGGGQATAWLVARGGKPRLHADRLVAMVRQVSVQAPSSEQGYDQIKVEQRRPRDRRRSEGGCGVVLGDGGVDCGRVEAERPQPLGEAMRAARSCSS